jgi:hypothetical protein
MPATKRQDNRNKTEGQTRRGPSSGAGGGGSRVSIRSKIDR